MLSKNNIAIIPARAGSKGIKDKNIKCIDGKPMIVYSIEEAISSNCFDKIFVTSDSLKIKNFCDEYDQITFLERDPDLSNDSASMVSVVKDVLTRKNIYSGNMTLLQPTSPSRTANDIVKANIEFQRSNCEHLVSVAPAIQHPSDFIFLDGDNHAEFCFRPEQKYNLQRQDFKECLYINGAIYITSVEFFFKHEKFYELHETLLFRMHNKDSIDIDNEFQFSIVENIINKNLGDS